MHQFRLLLADSNNGGDLFAFNVCVPGIGLFSDSTVLPLSILTPEFRRAALDKRNPCLEPCMSSVVWRSHFGPEVAHCEMQGTSSLFGDDHTF